MTNIFEGVEVVHSYSRNDALRDGVLVTLPADLTKQAGITTPVDMTRAAYVDAVQWGDQQRAANPHALQDEAGRAWDVLWMLRLALIAHRHADPAVPIPFCIVRIRGDRTARTATACHLLVDQGWTDEGEPYLVVMLPHES